MRRGLACVVDVDLFRSVAPIEDVHANDYSDTLDADQITQLVHNGDVAGAVETLRMQRPADMAEILMEIPDDVEAEILARLSSADVSGILEFLAREGPPALESLSRLPSNSLSLNLNRTPLGTAARVLRGFPDQLRAELIVTLADRELVEMPLTQDEETAGALVTTDFIALRERMTVTQSHAAVRASESWSRALPGSLFRWFSGDSALIRRWPPAFPARR